MNTLLDTEVDANFDAFRALLPQLVGEHMGQFALLRHKRIEGFFGDVKAAIEAGTARFADRMFSVQEVTDRPADLGFFSHAVDPRIA